MVYYDSTIAPLPPHPQDNQKTATQEGSGFPLIVKDRGMSTLLMIYFPEAIQGNLWETNLN